MNVTRRRTLAALGSGALASALPFSGRASASIPPLRVGVWATGIQLSLTEWIRENRLFEKYGLAYEWVRFADVNGNTLALATDRIDVAFSAAGAGVLDLAAKGRPVRVVLATQAADGRLVTNRAEIKSIADLRGRTIGMAPAGSSGAAYTKAFLARNYQLPADAYRAVGGGEARLLQLLTKGEIDAALLREVSVVQFGDRLKLRSLADQREEWGRLAGANSVPPLGVGVAQDKALAERRADVVKFVAAVIDGIRSGAQAPDKVAALIARVQKTSDEEARAYANTWAISFNGTFEDSDVSSLEQAQRLFVESGALAAAADRSRFDQSVYRDALKLLK